MGHHRDNPDQISEFGQLAALEAALTEVEKEPIPPRMRDLALRLQRALREAVARKNAD